MLRPLKSGLENTYLACLFLAQGAQIIWLHVRIWINLFHIYVVAGFNVCAWAYNEIMAVEPPNEKS